MEKTLFSKHLGARVEAVRLQARNRVIALASRSNSITKEQRLSHNKGTTNSTPDASRRAVFSNVCALA
eukprot:m.182832 g.182832  ORF g.182832 m.182832 type:complete len:68 (+) comp18472_c0_seq1:164-367(+)